jgi:transglutaminase-like putative cysteine protease
MLMIVALLAPFGHARAGTGIDASVIVERHVRHYVVEPDGTYRLTVDDVRTIAGPPLPGQGRYAIRYHRALDELVAVEAYTQKSGGRRIAAAPDATPAPQDASTRTIVFPDAAPGDRLVVHYVIRRRTPPLPGQFEDVAVLPPLFHRQAALIYDMPATLPLHADAVGFVPVPADSPPGRRRYQWRYVNDAGGRREAGAVSALDDGHRLAVSTIAGYPALAAAVRETTAGKALPTPAIAALAHRLTDDLPDTRARVLALSEWVRKNIRHVDAGAGAAPHPAATVFDTRHGDGKDHAVLLQALLGAVGIDSTPALVNGANAYRLPDVPVLAVLDHVILYVPGLDLFLDPVAAFVQAGYLPPALLGKPVLLLRNGTFAMTPVLQPQKVRAVATVDVAPDGRVSFSVDRTMSGALAEPMRALVRDVAPSDREPAARPNLRDVKLDARDDGTSTVSGVIDVGLLRTGRTLATAHRAWSAVDAAVAGLTQERDRRHDFVCPAIDAEDDIRLRLPVGLRAASLPAPVSVITGGMFYRAAYARDGESITITRRLTFRHGRATCTPTDARAMQAALDRIRRDLRSRVAVTTDAADNAARSGGSVPRKRVAPPARAQPGHGLVREVEAQVDAVPAGAVAAGPAGDLDEAAALEKAGRVRMRIDRHVAGPQLALRHVQQAIGQQRAADARAVAVGPHEAEHERAEVVELGQFVAAEADDLARVDRDEQRAVGVVQRGTEP